MHTYYHLVHIIRFNTSVTDLRKLVLKKLMTLLRLKLTHVGRSSKWRMPRINSELLENEKNGINIYNILIPFEHSYTRPMMIQRVQYVCQA